MSETRMEPCKMLRASASSDPADWVRCGQPEDAPIHDPLGGCIDSHPYDPAPVLTEDIDRVGPETSG